MFDQLEFNIDEVKFRINKMSAISAFPVLESIRSEMGKASIDLPEDSKTSGKSQPKVDAGTAMMQGLLKSILSINPEFVDNLRIKFFKNIEAKTPETTTGWLGVHGNEDLIFATLEASAIYELIVRSLVVNFTRSFKEISSRLKDAGLNLKP
jgi:hypothetical protein